MSFGTDRFWPAYKRAGMLKTVQFVTPAGAPDFDGRIESPTGLFADSLVQVDEVTLEYQTLDATLAHGNVVACEGRTYKVMSKPERVQDGWMSRAKLKEIQP